MWVADMIERGFPQRGKGRPKAVKRDERLFLLLYYPAKHGGLADLPRAEAVRFIAREFQLEDEAAGKAHDAARKRVANVRARRDAEHTLSLEKNGDIPF
jgi:hypothetical protein